jgi:hypothetical protein
MSTYLAGMAGRLVGPPEEPVAGGFRSILVRPVPSIAPSEWFHANEFVMRRVVDARGQVVDNVLHHIVNNYPPVRREAGMFEFTELQIALLHRLG